MKTSIKKIVLSLMAIGLLAACSSNQSLQEYYVDNSNNPNFISLDIPASILNLDKAELSSDERVAIESLKKLNVLAFKKTADNAAEFKMESAKVDAILKSDKFVELMKLKSTYGNGVVKYLGDEDAIDEVIIYGSSKDQGFALIRVLGKDMNPAHLMTLMQALQKSDYKGEGLGSLQDFMKG
ncbi:DUF4252 domain-containing protein [Flavobacteriaceae bacterium KMM 6897]|nr:DUF4252 domain-containing protein [Flavobacteriaceae bacterium KMM 6897]MEB8347543.1 DUF4252 domain-containing protein [Flavobacteriaceae bacterium KMM 6898]